MKHNSRYPLYSILAAFLLSTAFSDGGKPNRIIEYRIWAFKAGEIYAGNSHPGFSDLCSLVHSIDSAISKEGTITEFLDKNSFTCNGNTSLCMVKVSVNSGQGCEIDDGEIIDCAFGDFNTTQ